MTFRATVDEDGRLVLLQNPIAGVVIEREATALQFNHQLGHLG